MIGRENIPNTYRMPVIYSPRLAEIYRNAANRTSSILTSTPPANYLLTSDGNGATTWTTGGSTSNNPDLYVTNLNILNTLSSSSTFVNYLSTGNIEINTASFPQLNTNVLSTGTLTATTILARQLNTSTLSTASLYTSVANISSLQVNALSTGSLVLNSAVFSSGNTNSVSTLETTATTASASTLVTNTVSTGVLAANTVRFVTLAANSTLTTSLSTNQISTTMADVATVSTNALLVSSINNVPYPPVFVIPQDISFSTVTVSKYTQASSTFTDSTSTATVFTNLAAFSTLNTNSISASSVNASTVTTKAVSTTSISTASLYSGLVTVNTLNAQQITAQSTLASELYTNTINANTLSTGIGSITTVNTASLSTQTASVSSLTAATGLLNALSTAQIEANQIQIAQGNFSTLAGNSVSTGIFGAASATIQSISAAAAAAASVSTNSVSTTQIQSEIISTLDFRFSTLNGSIYPQLYATSTTLVLSTLTLGVSSLSGSTITNVLSTTALYTELLESAAVSTGTLSTGTLLFSNLTLNSFTVSDASISSMYATTLKASTINTDYFIAGNINSANYANTTGTISSITAPSYVFADRMYMNLITAPTAEQSYLSANTCIGTTTFTTTNFSSELSTGSITATSVFSQTAALSTLSTAALTIGQFTANSVFTNELSSQILQITAAASFQLRANTVSANTVTIDQLNGRQIIASSISTGYLQTSTAQISSLNANLISAASLRLPYLEVNAISTATLSTGLAYFSSMYISSAQTNLLSTGTFSNVGATFTSLSTNQISTTQAFIARTNTRTISTGTLSTGVVSTSIVQATAISSMYVSTNRYTTAAANIQTLNTNVLSTGGITVTAANFNTFTASNLSTGSYRVAQVATFSTLNVTDTLSTAQLLTDYLSVGTLQAYGISTYSLAVWGPNTLRVQGSTVITGPVYASQTFTADTVSTQTVGVQSMLYTNTLMTTSTLTIDAATGPRVTVTDGQVGSIRVSTISTGTFASLYTNISSVTTNTVSSVFIYSENVFASSLTIDCLLSISTVNNVANVDAKNITANSAFINTISTNYISSGTISSGIAYTSSLTVNQISSGNAYVDATTADAMNMSALSTGVLITADFRTGGLSTITTTLTGLITGASYITSGLSTTQISTTTITATNTTFISLSTSVLSTGTVFAASSVLTSLSATTFTTDRTTFRNGLANLAFLSTNQVSSGTAYIGYLETGTVTVDSFATQTVPATSLIVGGISTSLLSTNQFFINQTAIVSSVSSQVVSTGTVGTFISTLLVPTNVPLLQTWFDGSDPNGTGIAPAGGTTILTWKDKSGNGYDLVTSATSSATYTLDASGNYLNFLGQQWYNFTNSNFILNNPQFTIFVVERLQSTPPVNNGFRPFIGGTALNGSQNLNASYIGTRASTIRFATFGANLDVTVPAFTTAVEQPTNLWTFTSRTSPSTDAAVYLNGTKMGNNATAFNLTTFTNAAIGKVFSALTERYIGHMKEVVIYTGAMTDGTRSTIEGGLAWKWGIQSSLPVANPFRTVPPIGPPQLLFYRMEGNTVNTGIISSINIINSVQNVIAEGINASTFSTAQLTATAARIGFISTNRLSTGQAVVGSLLGSSLTVGFVSTGRISTNVAVVGTMYISTLNLSTNGAIVNMSNANAYISSLTVNQVLSTVSYVGPGLVMNRSLGATLSTGIATATDLQTSSMNVDFVSTGILVGFSTFANYMSATTVTVPTLVSAGALYISSVNGASFSADGSVAGLSLTSLTANRFSTNTVYINAVSTNRLEVSGAANLQYTSSQTRYLMFGYGNTTPQSGALYTSLNGTDWSGAITNPGITTCTQISWNGAYWLAAQNFASDNPRSTIMKSFDGLNWQDTNGNFNRVCRNTAWNGCNTWMAIGDANNQTIPRDTIRYSSDGTTWSLTPTAQDMDIFKKGYAIAYGNGMWVATGDGYVKGITSTIMYSRDTFIWNYAQRGGFSNDTTTAFGGGRALVWNGRMWVAVGNASDQGYSSIQYSYDGINWSNTKCVNFYNTNGSAVNMSVAWNGKMFIAAGPQQFDALKTVQYSYDGITWNPSVNAVFPIFTNTPYSILWDNTKWTIVGRNTFGNKEGGFSSIVQSYDGSNWINPVFTANVTLRTIAYSQPAIPDINMGDLQIFGQGKPPSSIGVHNIYATNTTIAIDNILYIDKYRSSVVINSELAIDRVNSSVTMYVSGIIQTYNDTTYKRTAGAWVAPSDSRIKENIQFANLETCYSTIKELNLFHYRYTDDYLSRVTITDKSILGFIAQDMAIRFPKSVTPLNVYGYENLLVMNTTQAQMAHYGATRFLMDKVDSISRQISSLVSIAEEPIQTQMSYLQPILSTFYTLESNLVSQSTLYGLKAGSYRSTLQSQTEQIYSLQAKFDDLVSNISSLLPQSS